MNQAGFTDSRGNTVKITFEQSNYIGERNMLAKPPYILLYSDEKIKELTKLQREFLGTLYKVGGVSTFDMT